MATPVSEKIFPEDEKVKLPRPFILRRFHSLLGLWLVLYLTEHLLVNSQLAFYTEDDGNSFITMVNKIYHLPYLPIIEIVFLGIPFFIHIVWGIIYLWTGKYNSFRTDGSAPSLPQYKRNRAYTWQRITAWLLIIGVIAHVAHMRFIERPKVVYLGVTTNYLVPVLEDRSVYGLADRLHVQLFDQKHLEDKQKQVQDLEKKLASTQSVSDASVLETQILEEKKWIEIATSKPLKKGELLAAAPNPGTAFLLVLRDTFKNPLMGLLYSFFVIAASYHAFNGLWTFLITWGVTLTRRSQKTMRRISTFFMLLVTLLGLLAAWGTYFAIWGNQ